MGLILHIETAEEICSVCLAKNGKSISLEEDTAKYSHASILTILIEKVIKNAGLKSLNDLDAVAVSMGPGSYTGLRIGTAAAKGICYGLNKPLIAVPTLLSMAESFIESCKIKEDDLLVPCIDARRMEVYYSVFSSQLTETEFTKAEVINESTFSNWKHSSFEVHFIGSGAEKISTVFKSPHFKFYPKQHPSAKGMVRTAFDRFRNQNFENAAHFEPFYLKDFVTTSKT